MKDPGPPGGKSGELISKQEIERSISGNMERRFLEARLLMLIKKSPSYGYQLTEALGILPFPTPAPDSAAVYRTLRRIEKAGYVRSEWEHGESGPSKRVYRITPAGRKRLAAWVEFVEQRVELLRAFIEMCKE